MNDASHRGPVVVAPGRRYLTLIFADLSHSSDLAEAMETEHYGTLLSRLRVLYQDTISRFGGTIVRLQGDGILAIFGYPLTRESDGRSAVATALELHQHVRDIRTVQADNISLSLHTGIHAGLVLLSQGNLELGRFELLGPAPNIAARLSDMADADEILVSEETLGPDRRFYVTGPPKTVQIRGRAAPVLVYRVDSRASVDATLSARARQWSSTFVGRQAELELLELAYEDATARCMRSVAIAGYPGVGKTRLIEQFLGQVVRRGCQVLRGYCENELGAEPLQPFRHMLQSLADEPSLNTPDAFSALFSKLAEQQDLVLFVDDWQWADDASHQVLAALRKKSRSRLLIVLSTRQVLSISSLPTADQTIELGPLNDNEAARVVAVRLPGVDPFVADEIRRHANGNLLFIEELCHLVESGDAERRLGQVQVGPGWLNRLVESRVQRLSSEQIEVVRVAAVIGTVIPAWLLERVTGQPTNGSLQLGLADQDFIFPGGRAGTLRFKHGITRDIIYESVGLHIRQDLHHRIALIMQEYASDDTHAEALAYHFGACGRDIQAAYYAEIAGDKALSASALDRARSFYRLALTALDRLPSDSSVALRWVAVVQRLGRVCVFDPVRSELALYERAVELAECYGDAAMIGRARHWLAYISYGLGDARVAIEHGERALVEAQKANDETLTVQTLAALGEAHCATAQYDRALPLLDKAINIKRHYRTGRHNNVGLAFSLVCRAYLLGDRGSFERSYECFDEAIVCLAGTTHEIGATVHGWRSAVLLWQGHWEEARVAADESSRIAETTRSLTQLSVARAMSAYADWMLTRKPEFMKTIFDVTAWLEPRKSGLFRSLNHGWLAEGLLHGGQRHEARRHASLALKRGRQRDFLGAAMSYRAMAHDAVDSRPDAAQRYVQRALKIARIRDSAHEVAVTQLCAAQIELRMNQPDQAIALLGTAISGFRRMGMQWHLSEAIRIRSLFQLSTTND